MNTRSLLALAAVALVLVVYLGFFGLDEPGSKELRDIEKQLFIFNADSINRMEITGTAETILLMQGEGRKWAIEKPIQYPADRSRIGRVLSELEFAKRIATIDLGQFENPEEFVKQFGLAEPRIELKFRSDEHAYRLAIGNETARKGNFYAQIKSASRSDVIVIGQEIESLIDSGIDGWRSKRIFDFNTTAVTSVLLKDGGADVELIKEADKWAIKRPFSGPTEPASVVSYLGGILAARVDSFAPTDAAQLAEYGFNTPQVSLEIVTGEFSETLNIGNQLSDQENLFYAQVASKTAVFRLTGEFVSQVKMLLNRVREKRIITASLNDLERIQIQNRGYGWSMNKEAGNWKFSSDGKRVDIESVNQFYRDISAVKGVDFFEKSDQNRIEYQLASPEFSLTVSSSVSGEAQSSQSSMKQLRISEAQDGYRYIESDFVEFLVKIPEDTLPDFPEKRVSWLSKKLALPDQTVWKSIAWVIGPSTLKVTREENGEWPAQWNGRELDPEFLQRQMNLLAALEIVARGGSKQEAMPGALTLTLSTEEEDYQLEFSIPENRLAHFSLNGDPEAYVINEQDYQVLSVFPLEYGDSEKQ